MIRQVTFDTKEFLSRVEFPGIPKWRMKLMTEHIDILIRDDPFENFQLIKHSDFILSRVYSNNPQKLYRIVAKHEHARQKTPVVCKMLDRGQECRVEVVGFTLDLESPQVEVIEEYHPVMNRVAKAMVKVQHDAVITRSLLTEKVLEQIAREDQIERDEELALRITSEEKYEDERKYETERLKAVMVFCESDQPLWSQDYEEFLQMVSDQLKTLQGLVTTYFISNRVDGRTGDYTKSIRIYYITRDAAYKEDVELQLIGGTVVMSRSGSRVFHRHALSDFNERMMVSYCKRPRWYVNQQQLYQEDCTDVETFLRRV
jgi:hypothetical protein